MALDVDKLKEIAKDLGYEVKLSDNPGFNYPDGTVVSFQDVAKDIVGCDRIESESNEEN